MKKGFTLVELLAVIVILAIILLISVPYFFGIIEKAKESSFRISIGYIFEDINIKLVKDGLSSVQGEGLIINNSKFLSGRIIVNDLNILVFDYFL